MPRPRGHSTFSSLEAANKLISATISANHDLMQDFLCTNQQQIVLHHTFKTPTGRVAFREGFSGFFDPPAMTLFSGYSVTVIIRKNSSMRQNFVIHTAYPSK